MVIPCSEADAMVLSSGQAQGSWQKCPWPWTGSSIVPVEGSSDDEAFTNV